MPALQLGQVGCLAARSGTSVHAAILLHSQTAQHKALTRSDAATMRQSEKACHGVDGMGRLCNDVAPALLQEGEWRRDKAQVEVAVPQEPGAAVFEGWPLLPAHKLVTTGKRAQLQNACAAAARSSRSMSCTAGGCLILLTTRQDRYRNGQACRVREARGIMI